MFSVILLLGRKKHCVYAFHPVSDSLGFPAYLIGEVFDHIWFVFFLNYLYSMAISVSSSMIELAILVR